MSVTQEKTTTNSSCPVCRHFMTKSELSEMSGELSDGLMFWTCTNCQTEVEVHLEFVVVEVVS